MIKQSVIQKLEVSFIFAKLLRFYLRLISLLSPALEF